MNRKYTYPDYTIRNLDDIHFSQEKIESKIYIIRDYKVMLDSDLAEIYGVSTKALNQAVKRNANRFPKDFMFQLDTSEWVKLRSQFVTSRWGGRTHLPFAFTEHGAVMLASLINSPAAVEASVKVVRAFVKIRELISGHQGLAGKLDQLEQKMGEKFDKYDQEILVIFESLRQLVQVPNPPRTKIGYRLNEEEK